MSAPLPPPLLGPHDKSAMTNVTASASVTVKKTVTDNFATLDNFVRLAGNQTVPGGILDGTGAIRHRDPMLTDNHKVTATIGAEHVGKTWLVACGSANFDRFYALEIESGAVVNHLGIAKGTDVTATVSTGLFGIIIGLLGFILGLWADIFAAIFIAGQQNYTVVAGDTVGIWWDEPNTTVRAYKNNVEVITLPVPRWEMPHGEDYRYWGVVSGIAGGAKGMRFTSITAQDV